MRGIVRVDVERKTIDELCRFVVVFHWPDWVGRKTFKKTEILIVIVVIFIEEEWKLDDAVGGECALEESEPVLLVVGVIVADDDVVAVVVVAQLAVSPSIWKGVHSQFAAVGVFGGLGDIEITVADWSSRQQDGTSVLAPPLHIHEPRRLENQVVGCGGHVETIGHVALNAVGGEDAAVELHLYGGAALDGDALSVHDDIKHGDRLRC